MLGKTGLCSRAPSPRSVQSAALPGTKLGKRSEKAGFMVGPAGRVAKRAARTRPLAVHVPMSARDSKHLSGLSRGLPMNGSRQA